MRFGYSDVKGFTDSYTMLFRYLKLGFNDRYILNENFWRDEEATREGFVLPALPYVVDGETKVTGDDSVITYVCIKANREDLLGKNGKDIAQVRMFLGLLRDMKTEVLDVLLQTDMPAEYEKIHQKRIEPRLIRLNNFLQKIEGNGFLLGYPTVADFKLYEMVNALTHYNIKGYDQYPNLTNFLNFFENHFENQLKVVDERLTSRQPSAQKNETDRNDVRLLAKKHLNFLILVGRMKNVKLLTLPFFFPYGTLVKCYIL